MSFDEMYDELVHAEFLDGALNVPPRRGAHAAIKATMSASRLRSIALITSGGLAFAALGAFLGGLGGGFSVTPAGAHALTSSQRNMALSAAPGAAAFAAGKAAPSAAPGGSGPLAAAASGVGASGRSTSAPAISSSTGGSSLSAPVSAVTSAGSNGGTTGGSSTGGSSTGGSSSGGSSTGGTGGTGGTTTGPTTPAPTSPVTGIVSGVGLSGVSTDLTQTLNGVVGSVTAPGTDLSPVTNPLTGVVSGVTSGLLGG
jgi:hypothetical protein